MIWWFAIVDTKGELQCFDRGQKRNAWMQGIRGPGNTTGTDYRLYTIT